VQNFNCHFAQFELLSISGYQGLEFRGGVRPEDDRSAGGFAQVNVPGNKIGVKVCLKDILDLYAIFRCSFQVRLNFAQGIYNGSFAIRSDVVGALCQTSRINLFDLMI
jgi:hypothetical protein